MIVLVLPPLRERGEDIVLLAQQFLQQYAEAHRLPPKRLSRAAAAWLQRYDWPGNVRELSHLMERVTLLSPEALIDSQTLERLCLPRCRPPHPQRGLRRRQRSSRWTSPPGSPRPCGRRRGMSCRRPASWG